jgi:hypothetical protein
MPNAVIGDSNAFYNLGEGSLTLANLEGHGEKLHYSPVTVIEVASKITNATFDRRRSAARAILDSGAAPLLDPQSHLTRLFGYELSQEPFDWSQAVIAISQAPNVAALERGVEDYQARVLRRVVISEALHWRMTTYDQWHSDMIDLMREKIPKFSAWWDAPATGRKKEVPKIKKKEQDDVLDELGSEKLLTELVLACQTRSFQGAVIPNVDDPSIEQVNALAQAIEKIDCYCKVYIEYVKALLTDRMLPQPNDAGDLELFLYLTDDEKVLATADKRWIRLAKQAGYDHRVRRV